MKKQYLRILPPLILLLTILVVVIIFLTIKRTRKENQVVTLVSSSWKIIARLNNLQNAVQHHVEAIADYAHGDNKDDISLADSTAILILQNFDSVKSILKTTPDLQQDIDSLSLYVHDRVDLSGKILSLGKEQGIHKAAEFFLNAPGSEYSNKVFASVRQLQLKTMQNLEHDEKANTSSIKQLGVILTILRIITLLIAFLIVRNFLLEYSVSKRMEKQLKNYNDELQENVARKTAEIRQSEERYRTLVQQASDAIIINDTNGNILDVNDNACNMLGYAKEELCSMNVKELVQYDNDHEFQNVYTQLAGGATTINERKIKRHDGSLITIETHAKMLSDGRIMSIFRDITERKRVEDALRASEFNNRMVVENKILGIGWASTEGIVTNANQALCDMMGYTLEEIKGIHFSKFTHPDDVAREMELIDKMVKGELGNYVIEKRYRKKNGNYFWVELNLTCYRDPGTGKIGFFIGLVHDIQEQKQFEEALKASEKKLRQVLSSYGDVFYVIDKNYQIIMINEIAEKNLTKAWGKPVYLGANLMDLIPAQTDEPIKSSFEKVFKGEAIEYELNVTVEGLSPWVLVTYFPVRDYDGSIVGAYVVTKDISERKKVEEELRQSNNRFELISRSTNDAIWEWDIEKGRLWANETHQELYGLKASDPVPVSETWAERIHPDDREKILNNQKTALASGTNIFISEYRFNVEGRGYRHIYDRCYIVRNAEGKAIKMMGSLMDITELKLAKEALAKSENFLRTIIETEPECVKLVNSNGLLEDMNPAGLSMIEADSLDQVKGKPLSSIVNKPYRKAFKDLTENVFYGKAGMLEFEITGLKGTQRWLETHVVPLKDAQGKIISLLGVSRDITNRKRSQEELRKSEERYRSLIEQASDAIMITDLSGKFLDVNSSLCEMFGYTKEELLQLNIKDIIEAEQLKKEPIRFESLIKGEHIFSERRMLHKNGTVIEVEANTKMIPDGRIIAIARDITERKKAEATIRAVEETRRLIMDSSMDAIVCMDTEGLISVWTTQSEKIFGWKEQEVIGKKLSSVIIPLTYRERHDKGLKTYLKTGKSKIMKQLLEFNALRKDGTEFPVEVSIVPVKQNDREFFCGFIRDITQRKKAEAEIKKARELSDHIINNLPGVFYLYDQEGNFLRWNKHLEAITGYNSDEIVQMRPWQFFEGDEVEYMRKRIQNVFTKGYNDAEAHFVTKDNKRMPFYFNAVKINYENQSCLLGYGIDISDRKKAEEELAESYIAIRHLSEHLQNIREEERTHIAREIHDELGQQLTVLKMDVSWLNKKLNTADENVKHKLKDLLELMDSTVRTVRRISSELRPSLLDDMGLVPAMEWHLKEFEKRASVNTQFTAPSEELNLPDAVKTGLFRIFQESLTNVARHANAKKVDINLQIENGNIVLSIKDDGKGFEMEKAKTKKTLGILGMQERSFMMGGNYEVKSKPGKGTKVTVSVPYSDKD